MVFQLPLSWLSGVFLLAGGLLLSVAVLSLRAGTRTQVRDWFLLLLVADAAWAVSSAIPLEAATVPIALAGETIRLAASSAAALCWLCFAVVYTGRGSLLTRDRLVALATPFVVHLLAFATNSFHGLSVRQLTIAVQPSTTVVAYEFGLVFLLATVYALGLTLVGTVLVIVTALTDPDLYADQSIALFVGSIMPIAGVTVTAAGVAEIGSTNLTPALLTITAVGYGYALFRGDLLTTGPLIAAQGRDVAVDSLEEGFLIVDRSGQILEANAAARTLLNETDLTGMSLDTVVSGAFDSETRRQVTRTDDGTVLEAQVTSLREQERRGGIGRVVTLRDVTEQQRQKERLQVLNRVLRHNVRNDLNVVQAFAEQIVDGPDEEIDPEEAARTILDSTDDLLTAVEKARMVEELLDSETTADRIELSSLLAAEAREASETADRPVNIDTDIPETCHIRSNEDVLRMVVGELLANAVRHADESEPWVELSVIVDEEVTIRVADDGPGIPKQDREAVLSGTETALEHSSRIGLWTVRWGVRYLGGDLSIEERTPTGTIVEISLTEIPTETEE